MTKFDFIDLASKKGLDLIDTTSETNGYPRFLEKAIIGFDTMEEAEECAQKYGLSVEIFHKRDGWNLWYRTGNKAYEPFTRKAEEFGADYELFTAGGEEYYYEDEVRPFIDDFFNFEDVEKFLKERRQVYEEILLLKDNQAVLTYQGLFCDVIKLRTMSYNCDTHNYAIGVIDWNCD